MPPPAHVARCGHRFNTLGSIPMLKIHPAIGIARVGGSDSYFIGPEVPGKGATGSDPDDLEAQNVPPFKDGGKIKRQAARFRIFHYPKDGSSPEEIDIDHPDVESIEWSVHLANRKAAYFNFEQQKGAAVDGSFSGAGLSRRNAWCPAPDRESKLVIDGGLKTITAVKVSPVAPEIINTTHPVIKFLGELRVDMKGRLLVLGGHGVSEPNGSEWVAQGRPIAAGGAGSGANPPIENYANNDFWFDDVSDGLVKARIKFKNIPEQEADGGAWVMVGPPDFAPPLENVVNMYDTMLDVAVNNLSIVIPSAMKAIYNRWPLLALDDLRSGLSAYKVDFDEEIKPIFDSSFAAKWVHSPAGGSHGTLLPSATWVFNWLRPPKGNTSLSSGKFMPMLLGDEGPTPGSIKECLALTKTQFNMVKNWSNSKVQTRTVPTAFRTKITPEGLDHSALSACVGGAFCPGIEAGWLMRDSRIYAEPFRIDHRAVLSAPLGVKVEPGFFSQQMALPWQADFLACSKEVDHVDASVVPPKTGVVLGWWPAQRPDDTFKDAAAATSKTFQEWAPPTWDFIDMVKKFNKLGFVVKDGANFIEKERNP